MRALSGPQCTPKGPLTLLIGVTGHRDPRPGDREILESTVSGIFESLRKDHPATLLALMSPLAEGADRLAARVAIRSDVRLIVPLPMPRELYEADFLAAESRAEFADLLSHADQVFELGPLPGETLETIAQAGAARNKQYLAVGQYIVRHCQILMALWDGDLSQKTGGTAQIVDLQLNGCPDSERPFGRLTDATQTGPVYHVVTPRENAPPPQSAAGTVHRLWPSEQGAEKARIHLLSTMDRFNEEVVAAGMGSDNVRTSHKPSLLPPEVLAAMPGRFNDVVQTYSAADALALHFQRKTTGTLKSLFALGFLAAVSFHTYSHLNESQWFLGGYLILLGVAVALYIKARRSELQNKHEDYRALAEGLRVQLFWKLAGLADAVADNYLHKQRTALDWVRHALRFFGLPSAKGPTFDHKAALNLVLDLWVRDQAGYYARAARRDHAALKTSERLAKAMLWLGLVLAVVQFRLEPIHPLIFLAALAPLAAATLGGYVEKRALSQHVNQYERMAHLFADGARRLKAFLEAGQHEQARALVKELGKEALRENGDWVLIHRERPLEVHMG